MARFEFFTVDVFTNQRFGGNPLAVFPGADGLSGAQMQSLARELNLSETTFVLRPSDPANTARVRIFTPKGELPFAGHPNVGTAFVLARAGTFGSEPYQFEEIAGLVRVTVERNAAGAACGAMITAPQPLSFGPSLPVDAIARSVGLPRDAFRTEIHPPIVASVGTEFVVAELTGRDALTTARPNRAEFEIIAGQYPSLGQRVNVHLYVRERGQADRLATRMFAPLLGIDEDPATGSANAALAALIAHFDAKPGGSLALEMTQGTDMGRPSRLRTTARKGADGAVTATVAGDCVAMLHGAIDL